VGGDAQRVAGDEHMNADTSVLKTSDFADVLRFNRDTASPSADLDVPRILRVLANCIGASVCTCTLRRSGWGKVNVLFHGVDNEHQALFRKKYFPRNPLTEWPESAEARNRPVVQNPTFVANTTYRNSEFFCQFTEPLGMHQIMVILLRSGSLSRVIGMWRSNEDRPFGAREQIKAELIVPALGSAIEEADPVGFLSHFGASVGMLDPFFDRDGLVVLSKGLEPLYVNGPACEMLTMLHTGEDPSYPCAERTLPKLLCSALNSRQRVSDGADWPPLSDAEFRLRAPRSASEINVQLLPLRREGIGAGYLLRLKLHQALPSDAQRLHDMGLSSREIDVVHGVAQGYSNITIADRLCISHHTVQTHLKKIYRKLQVCSRTALLCYINQYLH
jgi:DNA-binding CsgD family transcriptional regulator